MSRTIRLFGVLALSLALIAAPVFAEEQSGSTSTTTTSSTTDSSADSTGATAVTPVADVPAADAITPAAPAAPATPPALKPITITFSGDLTAIATDSTPAMITVQDRYGVKKEISVPSEAKIAQSGAAKVLADLKAGDKLTVEYTYDVSTGKRVAQSINVGEAAAANR